MLRVIYVHHLTLVVLNDEILSSGVLYYPGEAVKVKGEHYRVHSIAVQTVTLGMVETVICAPRVRAELSDVTRPAELKIQGDIPRAAVA